MQLGIARRSLQVFLLKLPFLQFMEKHRFLVKSIDESSFARIRARAWRCVTTSQDLSIAVSDYYRVLNKLVLLEQPQLARSGQLTRELPLESSARELVAAMKSYPYAWFKSDLRWKTKDSKQYSALKTTTMRRDRHGTIIGNSWISSFRRLGLYVSRIMGQGIRIRKAESYSENPRQLLYDCFETRFYYLQSLANHRVRHMSDFIRRFELPHKLQQRIVSARNWHFHPDRYTRHLHQLLPITALRIEYMSDEAVGKQVPSAAREFRRLYQRMDSITEAQLRQEDEGFKKVLERDRRRRERQERYEEDTAYQQGRKWKRKTVAP